MGMPKRRERELVESRSTTEEFSVLPVTKLLVDGDAEVQQRKRTRRKPEHNRRILFFAHRKDKGVIIQPL
jgi:hypothetical protein